MLLSKQNNEVEKYDIIHSFLDCDKSSLSLGLTNHCICVNE